jgi:hypothetical protein
MINLNSEMFGPDLSRMFINEDDRSYLSKDEPVGRKFKIKTKELILNAKDGHDTVTLKGIDVMHKGKKIGTWPSITLHMNKEKDYVEANYPELGTTTNLGAYLGPGFVFDTPHGSILKLIPILNFNSGKFGFGGIAKFRSATNRTDIAYGTAENMLMFYGRQKLDDNLVFQYGANRFMDEGFLGFRMPRYSAELIFDKKDYVNDFLGKKRELYVNNRISAGYVQGYGDGNETFIASSGIGTSRFRYMLDLYQTLYRYENKEELKMFDIGINMQGAATVYGTGNTQFIGRVGPRMHTQYKYWMQDIAYYQTAFHDESPVVFDQYVYGGGSVYLRESLRVHKYLVISWFGTFALTNDTPNGKMMQENSFFFAFGPDDFKINIGYDTIRQQSFITMAMNLDAKGSEIKYEKMTIKNPENLKSDTSDDYLFEKEPDLKPLEKAEVINIETDENL